MDGAPTIDMGGSMVGILKYIHLTIWQFPQFKKIYSSIILNFHDRHAKILTCPMMGNLSVKFHPYEGWDGKDISTIFDGQNS
jgi:hypothetical protein